MKIQNIYLELESYRNGNINQFKMFLKICSKQDLCNFISLLSREEIIKVLDDILRYMD